VVVGGEGGGPRQGCHCCRHQGWWVRVWGEGERGGCGLAFGLHVCHGWILPTPHVQTSLILRNTTDYIKKVRRAMNRLNVEIDLHDHWNPIVCIVQIRTPSTTHIYNYME
jgi:hypothetical protein